MDSLFYSLYICMFEIFCNGKYPEFNHLLPSPPPPLAKVESENHLSPQLLQCLLIDHTDPTPASSTVYPQYSYSSNHFKI